MASAQRTPISNLELTVAVSPFAPPSVLSAEGASRPTRKKLVRREDREYSQQLRLGVQLAFLVLNLWIGTQFYFWVRWAESAGQTSMVGRPAGVEGWLPIQGLMQFRYVLATGQLPRVHPAGFFLFLSFAVISLLFRKSFCGWLCPVGTVSEYLWKLGQYTFGRNFQLPRAVHRHISKRTPKGACAQALVTAAHAARLLHKRLG